METLIACVGLVGFMAYAIIGWSIASLGWAVWHDNRVCCLSWLLFPLASFRRQIGTYDAKLPLTWFKEHNRELPMLRLNDVETNRARNEYCLWLAVCWPVKVAFNLFMLMGLLLCRAIGK